MLKVNDVLNGFRITRCRSNSEIGGTLVELCHEKTGAEVCWMDNGNQNKLFAIVFKTLPSDDTGVFHILEHTTLCGSEKYPVREPFVELMKSSMNTFLNAMTGGDYTIYPVSSRSTRDYLNLVSVYLDAVFRPRLLTDKNIFLQEGWHIEDPTGQPSFRGVVYNEMKGDMSSLESVMDDAFARMLFPDTPDRFNSGGDPAAIPSLTWDKYRETYRQFYHPSNARVYLDGSVPLEETLSMLDEYYRTYEKRTNLPKDVLQVPKSARGEAEYELPRGEDPAGKSCLVMGRILCSWQDRVKILAARILFSVIASSNEAPLKKAVLDAGLAGTMQFSVDTGFQSAVSLTFKDIKDGCEDELYALVRREAEKLCSEGLDKEELEASIRSMAFSTLDIREPSGLYRSRRVMNTWLYGGDPMERLLFEDTLKKLRKMISTGGYERLLAEILLNSEGMCLLTVRPSHTLGDRMRQREEALIKSMLEGMTGEEKAGIEQENATLARWQETPDSPEKLATLPTLPLSEVKDEPEWTETTEYGLRGVRALYHPVACPGIVHVRLFFSIADAPQEKLPALQLMSSMFGQLPTEKHSLREIRKLMKTYFGRASIGIQAYSRKNCRRECMPFLCASFSCLENDLEAASELMHELLTSTRFSDRDKVLRLTEQTALHFRQSIPDAGHYLAMLRSAASFSAEGAFSEATGGITFSNYLSGAAQALRADFDPWMAMAGHLTGETFVRERMMVSLSGAAALKPERLVRLFPEGRPLPSRDTAYMMPEVRRSFIRIPAQVGSAVQSWEDPSALRTNGAYLVAANIVSLDHLWNAVRVRGGAYGSALICDMNRLMTAYSYRDPTPASTLGIFGEMENALRQFCARDEDISPYILSSIAEAEPLKSPADQGAEADILWLTGIEKADTLCVRREMLECTKKELLAFADLLRIFSTEGCTCIAAPDALMGDIAGAPVLEAMQTP